MAERESGARFAHRGVGRTSARPAGDGYRGSRRDLRLDLAGDPVLAAEQLIGWTLLVDGVGGPIVEAEAYRRRSRRRTPSRGTPSETRSCSAPRQALRVPLLRHPLVHQHRLRPPGSARRCCAVARAGARGRADAARRGREPLRELTRARPRRPGARRGAGADRPAADPPAAGPLRAGRGHVRIGITKGVEQPWRFFDPDRAT